MAEVGIMPERAFGELLRKHRLACGLAQETLAERAGISAVTISALERGARQKPYRDTIAQLAEALGLSRDDRAELERAATRRSRSGAPEPPASNLKPQRSSFVGREGDVAKVKAILSSQPVVTLVGAGGVGKTRLAIAVASELLDRSRDGIWFVDLSYLADNSMIPAAIASALGLERCLGLDSLVASLQRKNFLLLLDNCEHLIDGVALVLEAVLHRCPQAQILITSRQALGVDGERIFRVSPLSIPPKDRAASLSVREAIRFGAIRLFSDRAEAADSRFELTEQSLPAVTEICERLDGIALAIEIAAAKSNVFSLTAIAGQLREHFLNLTGGARVPVPRHKTMQALFDWSYDLLDSNERALFRSLAIFVGGFTLELARTTCATEEVGEAEIAVLLASLVDKSLVEGEAYAGTTRYRLLEPTRQFAAERLREHGEFSSVARKHALALLAHSERFDSMLEMVSDRAWDAELAGERENFRAAFNWAFGPQGDKLIGQQLTASRSATWHSHQSGESRRWVRAALAGCDDATDPRVRARLELAHARCAGEYWQIPPREALTFAERALSFQDHDDLPGMCEAQVHVGWGLMRSGRIAMAETVLREALATARSCGAQTWIALATHALGVARYLDGDLVAARDLGWEGLRFYRSAGCERLAAATAQHLAEVEFAAHNVEVALKLVFEAAEHFREHGITAGLVSALCNSSAYLLSVNRFAEARSLSGEALIIALKSGLPLYATWALQHLAAIAALSESAGTNGAPEENLARAAHVLGFVDEQFSQLGMTRQYTEQQEYDRMLSVLDNRFGNNLEKLLKAGKEWTQERAAAEALETRTVSSL